MRLAAKVDANQEEIVDALRKAGCSVQSLARIGKGCPDLLVGRAGSNYLLEVKSATGTYTKDQIDWSITWNGQHKVIRSVTEALAVVGWLVK